MVNGGLKGSTCYGAIEMIIEDTKEGNEWAFGWAEENDKFVHVIGTVS